MGADKPTQAVLKDLAKERALTQGDDDIAVVRAAYERVFCAWTAGASAPTREDWIRVDGGGRKGNVLVVEPAVARQQDEKGAQGRMGAAAGGPVPTELAGTILFLHGGGWSLGSALCYAPLCRALAAETGLRVIAPDFPQAPENPYPAALNFLADIAEWVLESFPGSLILSGDSAGGTLAAVLCSDPRLVGKIKGQALFYPVLDLRGGGRYRSRRQFGSGKYFLSEDGILGAAAWYCAQEGDVNDPTISPILQPVMQNLPPTFLLLPELDPLRDEGRQYARLLKKSGVLVDEFHAKKTIHGCLSFSGRIAQGREGLARAAAFMKACA